MSKKYKARNPDGIYFITSTVIGWVDVFIRKEYFDIIIQSLKHCQENKGLTIYAYVIMTSHLHLIVSADGDYSLSDIMRDFKKYTSKALVKSIQEINESRKVWMLKKFEYEVKRTGRGEYFKLWQDGYHPIELITPKRMQNCLDYIHNNPIESGFVDEPEDYTYSSAKNYSGNKALLDIVFLM
ncbi:transposase [Fulvivirgaceae bacterium BMA10]|uniref:Transposase n=1 Tax=Splendidivirga corallicola TaxID=3051826 RepID=A0ABT8KI31_9BACT|nr:transposase [Fulvivirgaceae bacterium BMA10]